MEPQKISASYIEQLIEVNEQALASFLAREQECDQSGSSGHREYLCCNNSKVALEDATDMLRKYLAFYIDKEDAEHRAERKEKSGLTGRMYE